MEGNWQPTRVVMLEFPSMEQAKLWYDCEEYKEWKAARFKQHDRYCFGRRSLSNEACDRFTVLLTLSALLCCSSRAQVTPQRLLDSAKEPQNWLTYSGDYAGHRFSALDQIIRRMRMRWCLSGLIRRWAAANSRQRRLSLMACCTAPGKMIGLLRWMRALAGRFWQYQRALPADIRAVLRARQSRCCHSRRQSFSGHIGLTRDRARCEDRQYCLGCDRV